MPSPARAPAALPRLRGTRISLHQVGGAALGGRNEELLGEIESLRRALADARTESESLGREKVALQKAAGEIAPGRPSRTEQQFFHNTARRLPLIASLPARVTTRRLDVTTCRGSACL